MGLLAVTRLQAFRVFSQHPAWVITPVNPIENVVYCLNIHQMLIHPHLNYGLAAWGQASETCLNKIVILQKKVLFVMHFTDTREHAIRLFMGADILP